MYRSSMNSRRRFLKNTSLGAFYLPILEKFHSKLRSSHSDEGIDWEIIRSQFSIIHWDKINFNSGSAGVMPIPVQDHLIDLMKMMNSMAPYEAWSSWQEVREDSLFRLSQLLNAGQDEIRIVRNTTEALNNIIYSLKLNRGDEIIAARHDYPYALNALENRMLRDGIIIKYVDVLLPAETRTVIEAYKSLVSSKTKAILVTHISHREGHIFPIKELAEITNIKDIRLLVDGAHSFAHIPVNLKDLGCDFYATSLHKWLNAPHGNGLLYIRKEQTSELHSFPSSPLDQKGDIKMYDHLGTRAFYDEIGISASLDFNNHIGLDLKYDRLMELKAYWTAAVKKNPKVQFHTLLEKQYSGAIVTFSIEGVAADQVLRKLSDDHNIHAKTVSAAWGSGIRITPNIYTNTSELDRLINGINHISK